MELGRSGGPGADLARRSLKSADNALITPPFLSLPRIKTQATRRDEPDMAMFKCLHHAPDHPHYRTYARSLAYSKVLCSEEGCQQSVIIWLNPEEVNDYERGSRLFYDQDFNTLSVDGSGLRYLEPAPYRLPRITRLLFFQRRPKTADVTALPMNENRPLV